MGGPDMHHQSLLPHLPAERIAQRYAQAPGNELAREKFSSPESSAALAANAFGLFLDRPGLMPPLPSLPDIGWHIARVELEQELRFPWRGGRHPWLDVVVESPTHLVGIESKRYEPLRGHRVATFSTAFWRDCWPAGMERYQALRDALHSGDAALRALDAAQLVKHALALATRAEQQPRRRPVLVYLYADPQRWPRDHRPVDAKRADAHRSALLRFASAVEGAAVAFVSLTYRELLSVWARFPNAEIQDHVKAVAERFEIGLPA